MCPSIRSAVELLGLELEHPALRIGTRPSEEPWTTDKFSDVSSVTHTDIGPITGMVINGLPFEKVEWSAKSAVCAVDF